MTAAAERDHWIRLFNRLEAAVTHHKKAAAGPFADDADLALWKVRDKILADAAQGVASQHFQASQEGE